MRLDTLENCCNPAHAADHSIDTASKPPTQPPKAVLSAHLKHAQLCHFIPEVLPVLQLQVLGQAAELLQERDQVIPLTVTRCMALERMKQLVAEGKAARGSDMERSSSIQNAYQLMQFC